MNITKLSATNYLRNLLNGDIDEIYINRGQGILYDGEEDAIYLVDFDDDDDDHQYIQATHKISSETAKHIIIRWHNTFFNRGLSDDE